MPSMPTTPPDVAELSYEQARDELVRVVAELEQGSATLEQSLARTREVVAGWVP